MVSHGVTLVQLLSLVRVSTVARIIGSSPSTPIIRPPTFTCANNCCGASNNEPPRMMTSNGLSTWMPMAASVSPARYADPAKVEKWFKRNCTEVLGRECTALEKGDWLAYMAQQ